jgi:iron complex outermembrane recepter protein
MSAHVSGIKLPGMFLAMLSFAAARGQTGRAEATTSTESVASERVREEIVVSALKREETAQDTPVVVTVMSQAELERYKVNDMTKIAEMTPQLMISSGSSGNGGTIKLRGIGSSSTSSEFDQVGVVGRPRGIALQPSAKF